MARVVILSFDDNQAAEAFVNHVWDAQDSERVYPYQFMPVAISAMVVAHAKIESMIARPTVSCRCRIVGMTQFFREKRRGVKVGGKFVDPSDRLEYTLAMGRWIKTKRYGWLVHDKCKRPHFFVVQRFIQNMHVGTNDLLPEIRQRRWEEDNPILGCEPMSESITQ